MHAQRRAGAAAPDQAEAAGDGTWPGQVTGVHWACGAPGPSTSECPPSPASIRPPRSKSAQRHLYAPGSQALHTVV